MPLDTYRPPLTLTPPLLRLPDDALAVELEVISVDPCCLIQPGARFRLIITSDCAQIELLALSDAQTQSLGRHADSELETLSMMSESWIDYTACGMSRPDDPGVIAARMLLHAESMLIAALSQCPTEMTGDESPSCELRPGM